MNRNTQHCCISIILAVIVGVAAFIFAYRELFDTTYIPQVLIITAIIGAVLLLTFFRTMMGTEKTRLTREAYCCCGKLSVIGSIGSIISALMTLLTRFTSNTILYDIGIALVFFFLTLALLGIWCFLDSLYRCGRDC